MRKLGDILISAPSILLNFADDEVFKVIRLVQLVGLLPAGQKKLSTKIGKKKFCFLLPFSRLEQQPHVWITDAL